MPYQVLKSNLLSALELELPYLDPKEVEELGLGDQLQGFSSKASKPAGVLALLALPRDATQWLEAELLLTLRSQKVDSHRGQISFPGGMHDEGDGDLIHTALRETHEEVGVEASQIEVLGQLDRFNVLKSGFDVLPSVGILRQPKEEVSLTLSEDEIDRVIWVSLAYLLEPAHYYKLYFEHEGARFPVHHFKLEAMEQRLWGATAAMAQNLLERLRASVPLTGP